MIDPNRLLVPLLAGSLAMPLAAQDLQLDVRGVSMPGEFVLDAYPAQVSFEPVLILPSLTTGTVPLQLVDPNDFRTLSVGIDLLDLAWLAFSDPTGHATVTVPFPAAPALAGIPIYAQAVTFAFGVTLVDRISNPNAVYLGNAGAFQDRSVAFGTERAFATAIVRADRSVLLCGGSRGQLLAQVATAQTESYDVMTDSWGAGPMMNGARSLHRMTQLYDGTWLFTGGVDGGNNPRPTCEIYDPVTNTFTPVASMNSPRMGHTATALADGRVFVSGGLEAVSVQPTQLEAIHDAVATTEIYDPFADTWTPGPTMSTPRAAHVALHRPDGKILLCGGISWSPNIIFGWVPAVRSSCELYDPFTDSLSSGPSMAEERALLDPIELEPGKWLLAGGMNGLSIIPFNPGNPTATAEIYDSTTNSWTSVAPMAQARANHQVWALGNDAFLVAGGAADSILSPTPLQTTEIYSATTQTFSPGPPLNAPRAAPAMIETHQGQILLMGGADTATSILDTTEWYYF